MASGADSPVRVRWHSWPTPPRRSGKAGRCLYGMSLALAVVIGFGIAGPIVARFGYSVLFYVLSAGLLAGFVITIPISEPPKTAPTAMPWHRLVFLSGTTGSRGRLYGDLQPLLHPRRVLCPRASAPPAGARVQSLRV